jgi:hypothetical protein
MIKTGQFVNDANKALTFLVKSKQGNGTWGSTSATILSLKALVAGMGGARVQGRVPFTVLVNGKEAARGEVTEDNADVMQAFDLAAFTRTGENEVTIRTEGETSLMYQVVGRHYQPWAKETPQTPDNAPLEIQVSYDRTKLATSDIIHAKATLKYNGRLPTYMVMVDLGIAPGFAVDPGDFAEMVGKKQIQRFSLTARTVTLYLGDVRPGDVRTFEYSLRARYTVRAQAPAAVAYEYYTPANRAESRPQALTVTDGK